MPDSSVYTIQDMIRYQYAKIIGKSSFWPNAKKESYAFIKSTLKKLQSWAMKRSDILREDRQMIEAEKKCVYCWATDDLHKEHIVPKSLKINDQCATCDRIQGIHNQIRACQLCNSKKSDMGLYHFRQKLHPDNPKYYDTLPPLLEKKYLKTIRYCHQCKGDLDKVMEGISVLDVDIN